MTYETIDLQLDELNSIEEMELVNGFAASSERDGFMSAKDKAKLDGMEPQAEKNRIEALYIFGEKQEPDENREVHLEIPTIKFFER